MLFLCFLTFTVVFFQKPHYSLASKNNFSEPFFAFFLGSVFISMYGFNQAFPLNLMTIWTFFDNGLWFHASFKFLMCIKFSFYQASWLKVFIFLKFPFFQSKMINYCEGHILFQRYWTSTLGNYPSSIPSL